MSNFDIQPLDKSFNRTTFDCGSTQLNSFIKVQARQNQDAGFNKMFVAILNGDKTKTVIGYYSLSMGEVLLSDLPEALIKKLPKHPVPIARMGRLAVDSKLKGKGLGAFLLVDAMKRVQQAAGAVGVYALLVDAKDENAKSFYRKYGFIELATNPLTLFLPLASFPK